MPMSTLRWIADIISRLTFRVGRIVWNLPHLIYRRPKDHLEEDDEYMSPQYRKSAMVSLATVIATSPTDDILSIVRECLVDAVPDEVYHCTRQILHNYFGLLPSQTSDLTCGGG